ncbi:MAG TPA: DNA polymerase III subunit delta [Limnochordia bacterium]|nr:DNA polymerase III subunit delta [Limnochordia bacterium]
MGLKERLFVLDGDDAERRSAQLAALQARAGFDGDWERLTLPAGDAERLLVRLATRSFFAVRRGLMVSFDEPAGAALDAVVAALKASELDAETTLVLSPGALDKRRNAGKWLVEQATVLDCKALSGDRLRDWLKEAARASGVKWAPGALSALLAQVGESPALLRGEIEKLALYAGRGETISAEVVAEVASHPRGEPAEFAVFRLVDALGARRAADALAVLDTLLAGGDEPVALLGMIARQFRLIYALKSHRGSLQSLAGEVGVRDFQLRKIGPQAGRWEWDDLEAVFARLAEIDRQLKSGADGRVQLQTLIARLCAQSEKAAVR